MSDKERYQIAKAYVDKKLKTMEENGLKVTKISKHEYETMVNKIAQVVTTGSKSATSSVSSHT
jgi:hypothetical protein